MPKKYQIGDSFMLSEEDLENLEPLLEHCLDCEYALGEMARELRRSSDSWWTTFNELHPELLPYDVYRKGRDKVIVVGYRDEPRPMKHNG